MQLLSIPLAFGKFYLLFSIIHCTETDLQRSSLSVSFPSCAGVQCCNNNFSADTFWCNIHHKSLIRFLLFSLFTNTVRRFHSLSSSHSVANCFSLLIYFYFRIFPYYKSIQKRRFWTNGDGRHSSRVDTFNMLCSLKIDRVPRENSALLCTCLLH